MDFFKKIILLYVVSCLTFSPFFDSYAQSGTSSTVSSFGTGLPGSDREKDAVSLGGILATGPGQGSGLYYNVHVIGEVVRPGTIKVLPSDRLSDVLRYAGGILSNGSERAIQLRRGGETKTLNFFDYKTNGVLSQNPYMTENDVIFVPLKKGQMEIEGPVRRPGFYELSKPISLAKAIKMAGGLATGYSTKQFMKIVRYDKGEKKQIIDVPFSEEAFGKTTIFAGDVIIAPHILLAHKKFDYDIQRIPGDNLFYPTVNDSVYVAGAVSVAGPYPFRPSFTAKDYVSLAGPQNLASLGRLKIISTDGKKKSVSKMSAVNAGDTIIVPSKAITAGNFITWFSALTSMALTTFIFIDRFAPEAFR